MSYEIFQKKAALNTEFELIPTKVQLYAEGVGFDANGYMKYDGLVYPTDTVKLTSLPLKIRILFVEQKYDVVKPGAKDIDTGGKTSLQIEGNLTDLSKILMDQLQNITDPEKAKQVDMPNELKKANTVCNIADKLITIVDLSLRAEIFKDKKIL
ncbi:hypothetical protein [Sulfurospirillum cavolei]|uniref:hypothetical protein n=1 Tax=Sulfurospirillum cavolei TaxID=366522 RepID=UPI0005A90C7C|nr:hypothetical protein [Sulfurospirillum cavolei]